MRSSPAHHAVAVLAGATGGGHTLHARAQEARFAIPDKSGLPRSRGAHPPVASGWPHPSDHELLFDFDVHAK